MQQPTYSRPSAKHQGNGIGIFLKKLFFYYYYYYWQLSAVLAHCVCEPPTWPDHFWLDPQRSGPCTALCLKPGERLPLLVAPAALVLSSSSSLPPATCELSLSLLSLSLSSPALLLLWRRRWFQWVFHWGLPLCRGCAPPPWSNPPPVVLFTCRRRRRRRRCLL